MAPSRSTGTGPSPVYRFWPDTFRLLGRPKCIGPSALAAALKCSGADLAVSVDHVFVRRQLAQAHGAAGVQFLRAYPDLGAEAELLAVGEPRRRIDDDRRRVHLGGETGGRG